MKKLFSVILASALALGAVACSPAQAADWNYVGGGYAASDVRSVEADALFAEGSFELTKNVFVQGKFLKGMDADFDTSVVSGSIGLKTALDESTDLYGKFTAATVVENVQAFDKYAYEAEAGIRAQVTDRVELRGGVVAANLRDARFDTVQWLGTAGAEFKLTDSLRLGADVRGKDNVLEGQLGLRLYF